MIKTFNPDFKKDIEEKVQRNFFSKMMGLEVTSIKEGEIEAELVLNQDHKQQKGFVHGGVVATIADVTAGFAAVSLVEKEHNVVTVEIKVSYLHPGLGEKLYSRGWVLKQGKKLYFCEAEVYDIRKGSKVLIAKATTTMAVITPEEIKKVKS